MNDNEYLNPEQQILVSGAPLVIEELDVSGLGLYLEKDPTVPDDDYFADSGFTSFGKVLWSRKSDKGIKWHSFEDKELKLWPKIK